MQYNMGKRAKPLPHEDRLPRAPAAPCALIPLNGSALAFNPFQEPGCVQFPFQ